MRSIYYIILTQQQTNDVEMYVFHANQIRVIVNRNLFDIMEI